MGSPPLPVPTSSVGTLFPPPSTNALPPSQPLTRAAVRSEASAAPRRSLSVGGASISKRSSVSNEAIRSSSSFRHHFEKKKKNLANYFLALLRTRNNNLLIHWSIIAC